MVAVMDAAMVLPKNRALPSPERVREGTKLKLEALAIAIAVASRLKEFHRVANDGCGPIVVSLHPSSIALCDNTKDIAWIGPWLLRVIGFLLMVGGLVLKSGSLKVIVNKSKPLMLCV